jgi:hypothetical protein
MSKSFTFTLYQMKWKLFVICMALHTFNLLWKTPITNCTFSSLLERSFCTNSESTVLQHGHINNRHCLLKKQLRPLQVLNLAMETKDRVNQLLDRLITNTVPDVWRKNRISINHIGFSSRAVGVTKIASEGVVWQIKFIAVVCPTIRTSGVMFCIDLSSSQCNLMILSHLRPFLNVNTSSWQCVFLT